MAMRGKWDSGGTRLGDGTRKAVDVCVCLSAVAFGCPPGLAKMRHQDLQDDILDL